MRLSNIKRGDFFACYENYYSKDVVNYEPEDRAIAPGRKTEGLEGQPENAKGFHGIIEKLFSREISEPLVAGNYFSFRRTQEFELENI